MKLTTLLLVFMLLLIPFQSASAKKPEKNEIVLVASQVDSADDIEAAIMRATERGTRSGTVILDGKGGSFVFSGRDKSLNIFVSNLTLRGVNRAAIVNCDDGLYFEGAPVQHILVENISFTCTGDGVEAAGVFTDITLRNNTFDVGLNGILSSAAYTSTGSSTAGSSTGGPTTGTGSTTGGSTTTGSSTSTGGTISSIIDSIINGPSKPSNASAGWKITENVIKSKLDGIRISGTQKFEISKNTIYSNKGVILLKNSETEVKLNEIQAAQFGVLLGQESSKNTVQANKITGVNQAGIAIEPSANNNRILANKVACASGKTCLAIDPPQRAGLNNQIEGNTLVKG